MALIGTMKYLTIGNQTYEIAGDELQIASASTLGGIKVGSGLSIDSTTGVLSTSITETDPVFAASAAAGITATDISNWNAKADSDVSVTNTAVTAATTYYLTGSTSSSTATGGLSKHATIKAYVTANSGTGGSARIDLGNTTATTSAGGKEGIVRLYGTSATYYVDVKAGAPSANRTITLPNKTGTVALTSDIPTIPSSTGSATTGVTIADHSSTTIYGVQSSTTSVTGVSGSTTASKVTIGSSSTDYGITAAGSGSATLTFIMDTTDTKKLKVTFSHTHTAPTLGSKVPTVSASDVTVPKAASSATTVPIKNASTTTVITSKTHSVTDNGHTHTI